MQYDYAPNLTEALSLWISMICPKSDGSYINLDSEIESVNLKLRNAPQVQDNLKLVESLRKQGQSKTSESCASRINLKLDAVWQRPESDGSDVTVADDDMPQIWWKQYRSWSRDCICQSRASESPADAEPSKTVRYHAPVSQELVWAPRLRPSKLYLRCRLSGIPKRFQWFCPLYDDIDFTLEDEGFSCKTRNSSVTIGVQILR